MQPTEQDIIKAYNIAKETGADSTCKVLEALYPDVDFNLKDNRPVEERIKTFEDAVQALGEEHPLVDNYRQWQDNIEDNDPNLAAYLKLRIIVAALNEGWEPEFTEEEYRWYPWFYLYTNGELAEKSDEWKQSHTILPLDNYRVVGRSHSSSDASGGLVYASADFASSHSDTSAGSRLAFKSEALAQYAGKQFIEIYADFQLIRNI